MIVDIDTLDVVTLKALYERESRELEHKLLNGAMWSEVADHRKKIADLSLALNRRLQNSGPHHPAGSAQHGSEGKP